MAERRALVCEDDPAIRSLVRTVVSREGFSVDVAPDGAIGIEMLEKGCYDLVVLDLMMPGVDGYAVLEWAKSDRPPALSRLIVMTAATEALRGEFPAPICTVLAKPFDISTLTAAVRSCAKQCS